MVLSRFGRHHDGVCVVFFLAISLCRRLSKMEFDKKQRGRFLFCCFNCFQTLVSLNVQRNVYIDDLPYQYFLFSIQTIV